MKLTNKEEAVLIAAESAAQDAAGGDFGFYDEIQIPEGIAGRKGLGGVLASLESKGILDMERVRVNDQGPELSQFYLTDLGWATFKSLTKPLTETDGQAYRRMANSLGEIRHELFSRRNSGDEALRAAQEMIAVAMSLLEKRSTSVV